MTFTEKKQSKNNKRDNIPSSSAILVLFVFQLGFKVFLTQLHHTLGKV